MMPVDSNNMQTITKHKSLKSAFSLVEVVIAVGIFAISIVAVIGLLGPTNKSVADVRDTDDATRVVGALQAELQRIAEIAQYSGTTSGFDTIGSTTTGSNTGLLQSASVITAADNNTNYNPATDGVTYTLFASKDGSKIGLYGSSVWAGVDSSGVSYSATSNTADAQKFFEIVLIRNDQLSANDNANPDSKAGFLAFTIRLRWPAYTPDGQRFTDNTQKGVLLVPAAIHR